jgi:hypothetical protein
MSSLKKDMDAVIVAAKAQGWKHSRTSAGHHQLYSPDGHTIVVASDRSSESHSFNNFMSEMRKGGYVECDAQTATQSLGSLLADALKSKAPLAYEELNEPPHQQRLTLPQIVIGFLERQGKACTTADITMIVKHHRPNAQPQSIVSQLSQLAKEGRIKHIARGLYGPVDLKSTPVLIAAPTSIPREPIKVVEPVPNDTAALDAQVAFVLGNKSDIAEKLYRRMSDEEIALELLNMQAALIAGLGRVEALVQTLRNRSQPPAAS